MKIAAFLALALLAAAGVEAARTGTTWIDLCDGRTVFACASLNVSPTGASIALHFSGLSRVLGNYEDTVFAPGRTFQAPAMRAPNPHP